MSKPSGMVLSKTRLRLPYIVVAGLLIVALLCTVVVSNTAAFADENSSTLAPLASRVTSMSATPENASGNGVLSDGNEPVRDESNNNQKASVNGNTETENKNELESEQENKVETGVEENNKINENGSEPQQKNIPVPNNEITNNSGMIMPDEDNRLTKPIPSEIIENGIAYHYSLAGTYDVLSEQDDMIMLTNQGVYANFLYINNMFDVKHSNLSLGLPGLKQYNTEVLSSDTYKNIIEHYKINEIITYTQTMRWFKQSPEPYLDITFSYKNTRQIAACLFATYHNSGTILSSFATEYTNITINNQEFFSVHFQGLPQDELVTYSLLLYSPLDDKPADEPTTDPSDKTTPQPIDKPIIDFNGGNQTIFIPADAEPTVPHSADVVVPDINTNTIEQGNTIEPVAVQKQEEETTVQKTEQKAAAKNVSPKASPQTGDKSNALIAGLGLTAGASALLAAGAGIAHKRTRRKLLHARK